MGQFKSELSVNGAKASAQFIVVKKRTVPIRVFNCS